MTGKGRREPINKDFKKGISYYSNTRKRSRIEDVEIGIEN